MKGILFTEPMFNAVIEGRKTQTRRIVKKQTKDSYQIVEMVSIEKGEHVKYYGFRTKEQYDNLSKWSKNNKEYTFMGREYNRKHFTQPLYKVGETVYIKEPYYITRYQGGLMDLEWKECVKYKYGTKEENYEWRWNNPRTMAASQARYFIEITAVRYERLQDISDEDCLKEGIEELNAGEIVRGYPDYIQYSTDGGGSHFDTPQQAYAALIDKINGKGTWACNPYVWVCDFKLSK